MLMAEAGAIWVALVGGFSGAVLGSLATFYFAVLLLRFQRRHQQRHEIWTRLLNSYQHFAHAVYQLTRPLLAVPPLDTLRLDAIALAYTSIDDVRTFDPRGAGRADRMEEILSPLIESQRVAEQDADAPRAAAREVFKDFKEDFDLAFPRAVHRATSDIADEVPQRETAGA